MEKLKYAITLFVTLLIKYPSVEYYIKMLEFLWLRKNICCIIHTSTYTFSVLGKSENKCNYRYLEFYAIILNLKTYKIIAFTKTTLYNIRFIIIN